MARKVFMSVLGSTNYQECQYVDHQSNFKSSNTRFVQVAMFEKLVCNWSPNDVAFIFLTTGSKGSEQKNWFDNGHCKFGTNEVIPSTGLQKLLNDLNLPCAIKPIPIRNGDNEEEVWKNFRTIFDCLLPGDEVYFDITHGFRSLPMLTLVLNNYSKFLKNIKVASITYGNYEARNHQNEAPIINLTFLSELQDWTTAAKMFITTGRTNDIVNLIGKEQVPALNDFINEINECRGANIYSGYTAEKVKVEFKQLGIEHHIFKELLKKVEQKATSYQPNDILNGFRAVEFCIQHQQIQQGITLLQEFLISYVLKDISYDEWLDEFARTVVSGCLSINNLSAFRKSGKTEEQELLSNEIAIKVFALPYKKKLSNNVYKGLSLGARNDLNHAGKRMVPKETGYFQNKLIEYFNRTVSILSLEL